MSNSMAVFVVDDDYAVRESLRWLIESAGYTVHLYPDAQSFLRDYRPDGPACLLLDVKLPQMSGLELQQHLNRLGVTLPIIMITGHGDVPMAVRAMKDGAFDFIEKPFNDELLLQRIRRALDCDNQSHAQRAEIEQITARFNRLTAREVQVMELVIAGKLTKQIAAELNVSPKTIEVHRSHVMQKMQAKTVADLVRMALSLQKASSPAGA